MNKARSLTLLYNSQTARPRPVVAIDYTTTPANLPEEILFRVNGPSGTPISELYYSLAGASTTSAQQHRLSATIDAQAYGFSTGAYPIQIAIYKKTNGVWNWSTPQVLASRLLIVDRRLSGFGAGWWPAGIERLYPAGADGSMMLVYADGSAVFFQSTGDGTFQAPAGEYSSLSFDAHFGYERVVQGGRVAVYYDEQGRLSTIRDNSPTQNIAAYEWSGENLISVTDPVGRVVSFDYSNAQRVLVTIPGLLTSSIFKSTSANVDSIADPDGFKTRFAYDALHRMSSSQARGSGIYTYSYDSASLVASVKPTDATARDFRSWQLVGRNAGYGTPVGKPDDAKLYVSWFRYTDSEGLHRDTVWFRVDRSGAPIVVQQPLVHATMIERDSIGQAVRITTAGGVDVQQEWNDDGNLIRTTKKVTGRWPDANTVYYDVTNFEYHPTFKLLTKITSPDTRQTTEIRYNDRGQRDTIVDGRGRRTTFAYWSRGLLRSIWEPNASMSLISEAVPTVYAYDSAGTWNLRSITDGLRVTSYEYDSVVGSDLTKTIDAVGGETLYWYDQVKRPIQIARGDTIDSESSSAVRYGYNDAARIDTLVDPLSRKSWRIRDYQGRVVTTCFPSGCDHTEFGDYVNPTRLLKRGGVYVDQEFDAAGRIKYRLIGSDDSVSFRYDVSGNLTDVDNRYSKIRRRYSTYGEITCDRHEIRGWVDSMQFWGTTARYRYDMNGRVKVVRLDDFGCDSPPSVVDSILYAYDAGGSLESITNSFWDTGSELWAWTYDGKNRPKTLSVPSTANRAESWSYDDYDGIAGHRVGTSLRDTIRSYDNLGRVRNLGGWAEHTYDYDILGRLSLTTGAGELSADRFNTTLLGTG